MPCNVSVRGAFQLTPSARRATETYPAGGGAVYISIHALREEGDMFLDEFDHIIKEFQSTPSARRATQCRSAYP